VQVVGGDQRQVEVLGQPEQVLADALLDRQAVVHHLDEEVLPAEDVPELGGGPDRGVVAADPQQGLHLAAGAARGGDQPLAVRLEQLAVHPRLVVLPLEAGQAGEPEQVVHALRGLGPHRHVRVGAATGHVVVAAVVPADPGLVAAVGVRREVGLGADDRLDPRGAALLPEVVGAEHVAVVGHRQRRHAHRGRLAEQVVEAGRAVEHGVLGVHVQVHERVAGSHAGGCLRTACLDASGRVARPRV
jgi:hypothetical protein